MQSTSGLLSSLHALRWSSAALMLPIRLDAFQDHGKK